MKALSDCFQKQVDELSKSLSELEMKVKVMSAELGKDDTYRVFLAKHRIGISDGMNFHTLKDRLRKLEDLTHANDYEYITETKLVKKNIKEVK